MADLHARAFTMPRPWTAAEFAALLAQTEVFAVTLPAGFALGRAVAGEAELLTIVVAPEARRTGRGHTLLTGFEATARDRGAADAFLEVSAQNAPALSLYTSAGWRVAGRRKGYYSTPEGQKVDALVLRKAL